MPATLRAFLRPPAAAEGPRVEQRASCAYFSKEPNQSENNAAAPQAALSLSPLLPSFPPSAGQDGPPLYPGPLCGGEAGSTGRVAGIDRDVDAFSSGQESGRKARPRLTDLPGGKPGKRQAGCSFSLVTFSLSTQRESDSGAEGARKPFASMLLVF